MRFPTTHPKVCFDSKANAYTFDGVLAAYQPVIDFDATANEGMPVMRLHPIGIAGCVKALCCAGLVTDQ